MYLRERRTGRSSVLTFPDISGGSFERQVSDRICNSDYVDGLNAGGGILLFINPEHVKDSMSIIDADPIFDDDEEDEKSDIEAKEWSPALISDQVKLVEILQFLDKPPFRRRPRRLAIIISAWDIVLEPKPTPEGWLEREMPLLHQFIGSNPTMFTTRVYGVSAQGGRFEGAEVERLLELTPSKRIQCIGEGSLAHDLSSPILWLGDSD